jgi:hypothetical protein
MCQSSVHDLKGMSARKYCLFEKKIDTSSSSI